MDRTALLDGKMTTGISISTCMGALLLAAAAAVCTAEPAQAPAQARPAQTPDSAPQTPSQPAHPPFPSPYDRDALSPEYRVAPGDVLQVFVWKEQELSREVRVRTDGYLTVPLLGDVFAVAKTPSMLASELAEQLGRFVNVPTVTVTVMSSSTQRFFVVGEVGKPGEFPLISRTTVLQALALAGGFREYAKTDEMKIIRQEVQMGTDKRAYTREIVLAVRYKALARGQDLHQNFVMKPGDVIVVP